MHIMEEATVVLASMGLTDDLVSVITALANDQPLAEKHRDTR